MKNTHKYSKCLSEKWLSDPTTVICVLFIQTYIFESSQQINNTHRICSHEFEIILWYVTKVPKYWFSNPFDPPISQNFEYERWLWYPGMIQNMPDYLKHLFIHNFVK